MNYAKVINSLKRTLHNGTALASQAENPFRVLIATMLSHRTRDEKTEEATDALFKHYATPKSLAQAPEAEIRALIKPVGFYRVKAKRVKNAARILLKQFNGKVPHKMEELLSIPGVGRKTADCVLVYAFRIPAIPVDTHVHRISNRLGWVKTKKPEETEHELEKIIPRRFWIVLNELLVQFGQQICKPIRPNCRGCPISLECNYYKTVFVKTKE
ncbi:MAG: endonuclease III [Candidatus Micrarchaeota archaeon]